MSFTNVAVVAAVAFAAPLALGLVPRLRLPAVVLEIVLGIVVGPQMLGWAEVDGPVQVLNLIGLAFLLLIAGLEVDFDRLRGRLLRVSGLGFAASFGIALVAGLGLHAAGLIKSTLLVAIMLSATSLGVVIPVLKDSGRADTPFGQLTIAGASIADIATVVLLGGFAALVAAVGVSILGAQRSMRISAALVRLQDTSAQIRVRGAFLLLVVFVVLADRFGLEAILGAFLAGAVLKLVDTDQAMTHPQFHRKLEAAGFGVFVPFFFVTSGLKFDLNALFASVGTVARVPLFLAALLAARGLPAFLYRRLVGGGEAAAAGLLQATSLSFLVVAGEIGMQLGLLSTANGAALVAAGLLSVLLFPAAALTILRREAVPVSAYASAP